MNKKKEEDDDDERWEKMIKNDWKVDFMSAIIVKEL